ERSRDDPGGAHGGFHRGGGPDRDPAGAGPVHFAGAGRHPDRPPAGPALRCPRDGRLPSRRGGRRPGLRRLSGGPWQPARRHGRVPARLPARRRACGDGRRRRGQRAAAARARRGVPVGKPGAGRYIRPRGRVARGARRPLPRRGAGRGRPALRGLRPDQGGPGQPRRRRRRPGDRRVAGL
ncbi:MAG: Substrate-specific component BioY of biotin ECF transporter, partial [uncultured Rubrobacteraceae bacterium]